MPPLNLTWKVRLRVMSKNPPTSFARAMSRYFFEYLPVQKGLSDNTVKSYHDTMNLFVKYCEEVHGLKREKIEISQITREVVAQFLAWLEQKRGCSVSTRNQRQIAITAFFKFLQHEYPECIYLYQQVTAIPKKQETATVIKHLPVEAMQMMFKQPNRLAREGRRDFAFLTLMYESAARASEIVAVTVGDVKFLRNGAAIHLNGKGKKHRDVPITKAPAKIIKDYLKEESEIRDCNGLAPLFCNRYGAALTRNGAYYIVQKYFELAKAEAPELFPERVHPHIFRHSRAMHLLEAGTDLYYIKDILGHADISTTEVYARLSVEMKRKILEKVHPIQYANEQQISWTEDKSLMRWLESLTDK